MKTETLSIDLLRTDAGTQARVKTNEETVDDYAELITAAEGSWPFGPLDVFHDGAAYFLADGFHRVLAALRTKRASVPCMIRRGTAKDAKIFGMTANDRHGLRMTRADKRACVEWLLDCGDKMTQDVIAEKAGVCLRTVKGIVADRRSVQTTVKGQIAPSSGKATKTGNPETVSGAASKPDSGPASNQLMSDFMDAIENIADSLDDDPAPDLPTQRATAAGSRKKPEAENPKTRPVVAEIVDDTDFGSHIDRQLASNRALAESVNREEIGLKAVTEYLKKTDPVEVLRDVLGQAKDEAAKLKLVRKLRKELDKLDPPTKFVRPDLEEVSAYFAELKATDPDSFFDFYESKGWVVGKVSMKDWKASARRWVRENKENGKGNNGHTKNRGSRGLTAEDVFSAESLGRGR